ncbi:Asp-tRNA(Asn)/Glu-tRNA(Gln) amidotransferase subunit GatC [Candidatus Wolfebacteria bacterium]|nr:Asp-tRNA(Asn)/Glu-tRNA(Gln) amidotransferase subunit GatC [Candidatus Wolfebacteria bacterium]
MSHLITKKTLEYLAELSRIELKKENEEKLLKDLQKILDYFEELKEVDTEDIEPTRLPSPDGEAVGGQVTGGTIGKNVFREDEPPAALSQRRSALMEAFPEKEKGFLKIPPVFE